MDKTVDSQDFILAQKRDLRHKSHWLNICNALDGLDGFKPNLTYQSTEIGKLYSIGLSPDLFKGTLSYNNNEPGAK
jgi:hypothetical protein